MALMVAHLKSVLLLLTFLTVSMCIPWTSFDKLTWMSIEKVPRLVHFPEVANTSGLIHVTITGGKVYAEPGTIPNNSSEWTDSQKTFIASNRIDFVEWYLLVVPDEQEVTLELQVFDSITLTDDFSEPINLEQDDKIIYKLQNPFQSFSDVTVDLRTSDLLEVYCNKSYPNVIPTLTPENMVNNDKGLINYIHSSSTDFDVWYFVLYARENVVQASVKVQPLAINQLYPGKPKFISFTIPGQQDTFILLECPDKGAVLHFSYTLGNGTFVTPNISASSGRHVKNATSISTSEGYFFGIDGEKWYMEISWPLTYLVGGGINLTVEPLPTIEVKKECPYLKNQTVIWQLSSDEYSIIRLTTDCLYFPLEISVPIPTYISIGANSTNPQFSYTKTSFFESLTSSQTVTYWILIKKAPYLTSATLSGNATYSVTPGTIFGEEGVSYYRLNSTGVIIFVDVLKISYSPVSIYCTAWNNGSWVNVTKSTFLTSEYNDLVDWLFYFPPTTSALLNVTSLETHCLKGQNITISLNDSNNLNGSLILYHFEEKHVGLIEISTTADVDISVSSNGYVPRLSDFQPCCLNWSEDSNSGSGGGGSSIGGGIRQVAANTSSLFPYWILIRGDGKKGERNITIFNYYFQDISLNSTSNITTHKGKALLRLSEIPDQSSAVLFYYIYVPTNPIHIYASDYSFYSAISKQSQIKDNSWNISHEVFSTWYYIAISPDTPETSFDFTAISARDLHMCNPVILCNGHGTCPSNRMRSNCDCLNGLGYGYAGAQCDLSSRSDLWVGIVMCVSILVAFIIPRIIELLHSRIREPPIRAGYNMIKSDRDGFSDSEVEGAKTSVINLLEEPINDTVGGNSDGDDVIEECGPRPKALLVVDLENICFEVGVVNKCWYSKKKLLNDISVRFVSGELIAIMGPSGSGKSTLLRLLGGHNKPTSGKININQTKSSMSRLKTVIGYVPQDDILPQHLTVREALLYTARLRRSWSIKKCEQKVDSVIEGLGLNACKDQTITEYGVAGGLSGGQKKRVSVGMEMVVDSSILLMDEPTSGLDSLTAKNLLDTLRVIAKTKDIAIIVVIHQPRYEIYSKFDKIYLLSNGEKVYYGPPLNKSMVNNYLQFSKLSIEPADIAQSNPADLMLDFVEHFDWPTLQITVPLQLIPDESILPIRINKKCKPTFQTQLFTFTKRAYLQLFRTFVTFFFYCLLVSVAGGLVSWAFHDIRYVGPVSLQMALTCPSFVRIYCFLPTSDDYFNLSLLISLCTGLTAMTTSLPAFKDEKLVFLRESYSGTSTLAYFLAKNFAEIPHLLVLPLFFTTMLYLLTDPIAPPYKIYLMMLGLQFSSMGFGYMAATFVQPNQSLILGVIFVFVSIILSGFKPSLRDWKNQLGSSLGTAVPSVSYARWGMEGLYLAQVEQYDNIYNITTGVELWGYEEGNFQKCLFILFELGLIFRVITFIALKSLRF